MPDRRPPGQLGRSLRQTFLGEGCGLDLGGRDGASTVADCDRFVFYRRLRRTPMDALNFELNVLDMLQSEVNSGALGVSPQHAKLFHRKSYFSMARGKDIVFDVALELTRDGAQDPLWIWLWECKNYGRPVPVDDVEEFHSKLEQIVLHEAKGTIVTSVGFQQSAFNFAHSAGIGLARVVLKGERAFQRILEFPRPESPSAEDILKGADISGSEFTFSGMSSSGILTASLADMISLEFGPAVGPKTDG